jgi:hypothetical protein
MNIQFLKDHLIYFEIVAAIAITALLRCGFDVSWLFAIPVGLSAFVLIPMLILAVFVLRAAWMMQAVSRIMPEDVARQDELPSQMTLAEVEALREHKRATLALLRERREQGKREKNSSR